MPEQIAKRLHDNIQQENLSSEDRLFPICCSTARESEWRRNHTEEYNRKNLTPQNFNWLKEKCFQAYDLHIKTYGYESLGAQQKLFGF